MDESADGSRPDRFTAEDVEVLAPLGDAELWSDPDLVEDGIAAISADADTFEHLQRRGIAAYPDGLHGFAKAWRRTVAEDLPRLERMARDGTLSRMDGEIEEPLRARLRDGREALPDRYAALKRKLSRLAPVMREHGFAEPMT